MKWSIDKNKIFFLLWTDFTTRPSVFIVDFEQVSAGCEAKGETDYRIHLNEFRASKSLYWKESKWDQRNFLLIFLLKLCSFFCFTFLLKILNQKATVSKETIGFIVRMATILSYIKKRSNRNYHNRLFNSTALFVVYKWPLRIEIFNIKLNEIKFKCLKLCFLNSVAFSARTQIKVDLQMESFCRVTLGPAFLVLEPNYGTVSRFLGFLRVSLESRFSGFRRVLLGSRVPVFRFFAGSR